jgi:hypothetical protein
MKKTKEEIQKFIIDTLLPYKEDINNRAIEKTELGNTCCYLTEDGRKCAIGKHMVDGSHQDFLGPYLILIQNYNKEDIFTQEFLNFNFSDNVCSYIQDYHDALEKEGIANNAISVIEKELNIDLSILKFKL